MKFMSKLALVAILASAVSLLFAAAKGDVKKGQELYTTKCKQCHGDQGKGNPAVEKMFNVKIPQFASKEVQSTSDEQLGKMMLEGKGKMKPVKMTNVEAADVLAYLRSLTQEKK